jgi:DNA (cytosine-5)-methyltransferase 1
MLERPIPVIDLFAGPGGLGEGFASLRRRDGEPAFRISLSIEKERDAHKTLLLRSLFRQFPDRPPASYYEIVRSITSADGSLWARLKEKFPREAATAESEARNAELGRNTASEIDGWITRALQNSTNWVLIGGPPCQAYSIAGRSRNSGNPKYVPEADERQYLYREYLRILAKHLPAVFIMENVKGLLSASLKSERIFERILDDLRHPRGARARPRYRLFSLVKAGDSISVGDYVVQMERYGVPQARHRLILMGLRDDLDALAPGALTPKRPVTVCDALRGLPPLRSGLSESADSAEAWRSAITQAPWQRWVKQAKGPRAKELGAALAKALDRVRRSHLNRGAEFLRDAEVPKIHWYSDQMCKGIFNHRSRTHLTSDLHRYFFAAVYAETFGRSPILSDFPRDLLPRHKNVTKALKGNHFSDRFRVQLRESPATTVTSHISKDGHYYIHYDPGQCRSLTVREAARLQTFPDNYVFCGPRTSQYVQVGNAVPPLLAYQIAEIVFSTLSDAGAT